MVFRKKRNLALVLSGGSARALAHIGVLEVLEEHHVPIDAIVGTSMGALVGGLYAAGKLNEFKKDIIRISSNKLTSFFLSRRLKKMNTNTKTAIGPFLKKYIGKRKIEDLDINFTAIATDLKTGEEVFLNKGSLLNSIFASIALPGVFQPVELGERILIDGGVVDPLPQKYGHLIAEKVIAVNAMPRKYKYKKCNNGVFEVLSTASDIMLHNLMDLKKMINIPDPRKNKFIFIQLKTRKRDPFDFYNIKKIIDLGRKEAKKNIKKIKKLVVY
jgi:NTE family protein